MKKNKRNLHNENTAWKTQNEQPLDRVQSTSCFSKEEYYERRKTYESSCGDYSYISISMPSTPEYSFSSVEHLAKSPLNPPRREHKTLIVILASMTFFVQTFSRDLWRPLLEPGIIAFPGLTRHSPGMFPVWNVIMSVCLVLPISISVNKYGLKTCLMSSCILSTFGTGLRCLSVINDSAILIYMSAACLSCALVLVKPLTVTISSICFRKGERNFATGIQTSASMAGTAAALFLPIILPKTLSLVPVSSAEWKNTIMYIMYGCFFMNAMCTLLVYTVFPLEESSAITIKFVQSKVSVRRIVTNKNLLFVALSYACSNALSWPWFQHFLNVTYAKIGFSPHVGTDCRFAMLVNTCLLTLSVCWFADQHTEFRKRFGLICLGLSSVFLMLVLLMLTVHSLRQYTAVLVICVFFAFPLSWTTQSLTYEIVADNADPIPETIAVGLVELTKLICEGFVYLFIAIYPAFYYHWLNAFTVIFGLLGLVFFALQK